MSQIASLNRTYTGYMYQKQIKKSDSGRVQTHTWFSIKADDPNIIIPRTLEILDDEEFLNIYHKYITSGLQIIPPTITNPTPFISQNEVTEKIQKITRLFFDIDLDAQTAYDHFKTSDDVYQFWKDIREWIQDVVYEAFEINAEPIFAFRLFYKCHVYVHDIVLTSQHAKTIAGIIYKKMKTKYEWTDEKMIDQSVYTSGLRMLYSHKRGMSKKKNSKSPADSDKHEKLFPDIPFREWYQITTFNNDYDKTKLDACISYSEDLSLEDLKQCSIHTNEVPTLIKDKNVLIRRRKTTATTSRKRPNNNNDSSRSKKKSRKDVAEDDEDEKNLGNVLEEKIDMAMEYEDEEGKEELPDKTCRMIRKYLRTELPVLRVYPKIKSIYRYINTGYTIVDLVPVTTNLKNKLIKRYQYRTGLQNSEDLENSYYDDQQIYYIDDDDDDDDSDTDIDDDDDDDDDDDEDPPPCFFGKCHERIKRGVPTHYVIFNCKGAFLRCWACNQRVSPQDTEMSGIDTDMRIMSDDALMKDVETLDEDPQQLSSSKRQLYSFEIPHLTAELHNLIIPKDALMRFVYLLHDLTDSAIGNYIVNAIERNYVYIPYGKLNWYRYEPLKHLWSQQENIIPDITMAVGGQIIGRLRQDCNRWERSTLYTNLGEDLQQYLKKRYQKLIRKISSVTEMCKIESTYIGPTLLDRWRHSSLASGLNTIGNVVTRFNSVPTVIACTNGVFDLETKRLRPGRPEDWNTFTTGNKYIPYNKQPIHLRERLEEILSQIFTDPQHLEYVLHVFAKALNGYNQAQEFYFLSGKGANGKSVTCKLIELALGDYCGTLPIVNLTGKQPGAGQATPELVDIIGKRFVFMHEPNQTDRLNLSFMKLLSGGDTLRARGLFKDPVDFTLQATMFMLTNDIPNIAASSTDNGAWRRIKVCSFESRFCEKPSRDPAKHEFKTNPNLQEELVKLAPVFLSLLIDFYIRTADKSLPVPKLFEDKRKKIIYDNDVYTQFFTECLHIKNNNDDDNDDDLEQPIMMTTQYLFTQLLCWSKSRSIPKSRLHYSTFQDALQSYDGFTLDENDCWNVTVANVVNINM